MRKVNKEPHAMCDEQRLSLIRCEVAPLTTSSGFFLLVVSGITSKFARSNQTFWLITLSFAVVTKLLKINVF